MRFFQKGELGLLWPFYLEYFVASVIFFMPAFMVLYFIEVGLTGFQMGILFAALPLSSLIFEIPTGAFADLYGRKASVLLGYSLEALAMLGLFFWRNFTYMFLLFILMGFASTFSSGSKDAWVVDLIKKKKKNLVHVFFSKMMFFINFGLIFSGILGVFFVKHFGLSIIWIATFLSYILSISILYFFTKENYIVRKSSVSNSFKNLAKQSKFALNYSKKHHVLFYLIFAGVVSAFALHMQGNIAWISFLSGLGMKSYFFGYLWSAMALVMAISPLVGSRFFKKKKERNFIVLSIALWVTVTLFVVFAFNLLIALIVMLLALFFYFLKSPIEEAYFHRFVPSKSRATIGSVKNMAYAIAMIICLPIGGYLVDVIGGKWTIFISAIIMIPSIILYLIIKEREND